MGKHRSFVGIRCSVVAASVFASVLATSSDAGAAEIGCGAVITQSTTLHQDVGPCPGLGLIVAADDITLDLNGYRVFGDPQVRNHRTSQGCC